MKTFLLFILISFTFIKSDNIIYWDERRELTWNDFIKTKYISCNKEDAKIAVKFYYYYERGFTDNYISFTIRACMNRMKSFVVVGSENNYLLNHEQVHFDLQEIYARKLRKELSNHCFIIKSYEYQIDSIISKYTKLSNEIHDEYDIETNHSKNKEKQSEWDIKVKDELELLNEFSNPSFKISFKHR